MIDDVSAFHFLTVFVTFWMAPEVSTRNLSKKSCASKVRKSLKGWEKDPKILEILLDEEIWGVLRFLVIEIFGQK